MVRSASVHIRVKVVSSSFLVEGGLNIQRFELSFPIICLSVKTA